jgi:hypothetical protein
MPTAFTRAYVLRIVTRTPNAYSVHNSVLNVRTAAAIAAAAAAWAAESDIAITGKPDRLLCWRL